MRINPKYKVRKVADENIVLVQGANPGDMTTVIALNESSLYLWNSVADRDFETNDISQLLMERYDVDPETAAKDASNWIETLQKHQILS